MPKLHVNNNAADGAGQAIFFNIAILLLYLQFQLAYLICIVMRINKRFIRQTYSIYLLLNVKNV